MTAGFYALRSSGEVLIDDNGIVLSIQHRGSISTTRSPSISWQGSGRGAGYYYSDGSFGGIFVVTYPTPINSPSPPVIVLIPKSTAKGCFHALKNIGSPGNWTGFEIAHHRDMKGWERTGASAEMGPFTASEIAPNWDYAACRTDYCINSNVNFGLKVWNPAGTLIFDSGAKIARIMSPLTAWVASSPRNNYGFVRYQMNWPYVNDGTVGIIASSLSVHLMEYSASIGNSYASPRIGFSSLAPGKILMTIGGTNSISYSRLAPGNRGWLDDDTRLDQFYNQGGGLESFAVKVPAT